MTIKSLTNIGRQLSATGPSTGRHTGDNGVSGQGKQEAKRKAKEERVREEIEATVREEYSHRQASYHEADNQIVNTDEG